MPSSKEIEPLLDDEIEKPPSRLSTRMAELRQRWADSGPFTQARILCVAAAAALSVTGVWLTFESVVPIVVRHRKVPLGSAWASQIEIQQNMGNHDRIRLEIRGQVVEFDGKRKPGSWTAYRDRVDDHSTTKFLSGELSDSRGIAPPSSQLELEYIKVLGAHDNVLFEGPPTEVK